MNPICSLPNKHTGNLFHTCHSTRQYYNQCVNVRNRPVHFFTKFPSLNVLPVHFVTNLSISCLISSLSSTFYIAFIVFTYVPLLPRSHFHIHPFPSFISACRPNFPRCTVHRNHHSPHLITTGIALLRGIGVALPVLQLGIKHHSRRSQGHNQKELCKCLPHLSSYLQSNSEKVGKC